MKANANSNDLTQRTRQDIPMRGKAFCGHCDKAFIPSYSKKKQIAYYYYSCSNHDESSEVCNNCPIRKLPAELIEDFAKSQSSSPKIFLNSYRKNRISTKNHFRYLL